MYETVDELFTGICDSIREKDGTTALIRHQDIPSRIAAISCGGSGVGEAFTSPFYTCNGSGMKVENMVASNFVEKSAIFLSEAFIPGDATWEIGVKFTWPETINSSNTLFGSYYSNPYCQSPSVSIGYNRDLMRIFVGIPDGSNNWNIRGECDVNAIPGKWYYTKLIFDGEKYIVSLSEDGRKFEDIIQIDYGVMYQNATYSKLQFGGRHGDGAHSFNGSIDIKETYIKINGEVWWGRG